MTTNEIKTLIQNTIAGQGSQVDIGGQLAGILSAIVDSIPTETPRPIVLSSGPLNDDTIETLAEKGLTLGEIEAAAKGLRTCVSIQTEEDEPYDDAYAIVSAFYGSSTSFHIVFCQLRYDDGFSLDAAIQYAISCFQGVLTVKYSEL